VGPSPTDRMGTQQQRCVLYVFDGLMETQADDPAVMPRLAAFRKRAARMRTHRPIFPSVTRGNAAAIATGCFPGTHGFNANRLKLDALDSSRPTEANDKSLRDLHAATGEAMLTPTLGELLAPHGLQYWGLGSWTNGCAIMHHPPGPAADGSTGAALHAEFSMPAAANEAAAARFGPWPTAKPYPHEEDYHAGTLQMAHALRLAKEWIIPEEDPAVLCLWTCEPDHVQHYSGLGSKNDDMTLILRRADEQFGEFLDYLNATGRMEHTNVLAMSDHGHYTIKPPPPELQASGCAGVDAIEFGAVLENALGLTPPRCVSADNAGGVMIYLQDAEDIELVAGWLMAQEYIGPILATESRGVPLPEGTLPLSCLGMEGPRAPDLAFSLAWSDEVNQWGHPGHNYQVRVLCAWLLSRRVRSGLFAQHPFIDRAAS
jgi:phosphonoacetate hydrolase